MLRGAFIFIAGAIAGYLVAKTIDNRPNQITDGYGLDPFIDSSVAIPPFVRADDCGGHDAFQYFVPADFVDEIEDDGFTTLHISDPLLRQMFEPPFHKTGVDQ